jgi:hypothetical protein
MITECAEHPIAEALNNPTLELSRNSAGESREGDRVLTPCDISSPELDRRGAAKIEERESLRLAAFAELPCGRLGLRGERCQVVKENLPITTKV